MTEKPGKPETAIMDEIKRTTDGAALKWALTRELARAEQVRQLARLGAAMPRLVNR